MKRQKAMATTPKPTSTPKLRFPEFRSRVAWHKRKLSRLLSEPKQRNRDLKFGANDVLSVSGEFGCVNQIALLGRSYAGASVENYHVVQAGDVVYTKSPLKRNPYGIIKANKGRAGIVSTLYAVYRPTAEARADYLDYYFSSDYHLNSYLQPIVKKGAKNDMKVNNSDVLTGEVWVPEIDEQEKIAECLSTLDELIGAESQELDALKAHKKGLMQQLFPRQGETVPRLRFSEFRDTADWDEKTLGDIVEVASGQVDPREPPYCDMPHVGGDNIESHTGELKAVKTARELGLISGKYFFDNRDVLYSKIRPALNKVATPDFVGICSADIYPLRPSNDELIREYLAFLLLSERFVEYASKHSDRSKIPKVNRDSLLAYTLSLPRPAEQHCITSCLSSLDKLIAAQSDKVEALRTHKKGLMQQLFPSPAEVVE